jgi:hypothetical protein
MIVEVLLIIHNNMANANVAKGQEHEYEFEKYQSFVTRAIIAPVIFKIYIMNNI